MKKALYMLSEFSDRDFEWLLAAGQRKRVPVGSILIYEGKAIDALYIVLEGKLSVCVEAFGDEEIARIGAGEVVGEMSFVDAHLPSATVKALEDAQVWSISRNKLATKLLQDMEFGCHFYHAIAAFLSDRLRETVSRLGYSKDSNKDTDEDNLNPQTAHKLELARARLGWLLSRLKDTP